MYPSLIAPRQNASACQLKFRGQVVNHWSKENILTHLNEVQLHSGAFALLSH